MEVCLFFFNRYLCLRFLLLSFVRFVCVVLSAYVCTPHAFSVLGNQKKVLYTLELGLRIVVSYHMDARIQT